MSDNTTHQLAVLFLKLRNVRTDIYSTILPLCAHLAPEEMAELLQAMEIAASTIDATLAKYRLEMVARSK